ncbi:sensor histidine kinase [Actibacterium lipolyticum]|uniref:histidine kinase n=1 Tax=Actibacterium lipolyticum TaxID=1524263 RepID=A0A238KFI3_9RHOB|nr:sensor histidine kinase [Actibacterium lipolyticum]SMX41558.1 Sensor protein QseC [Actibacterium lipolyticum]
MRSAPHEKVSLSLTARVALAVTGVLLIGGVFVSLAAFAYGRQAAREAYDRLLIGAANDIAASITVRDGQAVVDLPRSAFQLLALAPDDRIIYRVVGPAGQTLTGYETAPLPKESMGKDQSFFDADFGGEPARYATVIRRFAERSFSGNVHVIVGHTTLARRDLALDLTRNALFVLSITGAVIAVLAVLAVRSALRPLDNIGEVLGRRDPYDLTPIEMTVPREAAVMMSSLNGFMARLDRQVSSMRNLIGDTAHQLRTPVAAIRAQADLAAEEQDETRRQKIVERIHRRSVGLGRLLDQMLSRALVIHRSDTVRREVIDLRDIAVEVLEDSDHDVLSVGDDVRLDLPEDPVLVMGDALSLTEASKNLLNNAMRHGKKPITVGVSVQAGQARLSVTDAGQGPPAEILSRAGERFARSAASKSESAGLGLAIAYSVARAHDGQMLMEPQPSGGFVAAIILPATEV